MQLTRRNLLKTLAACTAALAAQEKKGRGGRGRIDVHHHMLPPFQPSVANRKYTPQVSIDEMDKFGTESAILSLTIAADLLYDGSDKARSRSQYAGVTMLFHPRFPTVPSGCGANAALFR